MGLGDDETELQSRNFFQIWRPNEPIWSAPGQRTSAITAPKLKIIVRRNEPHCPDVHRRGITKEPRCGARISAPTDPNHAEPEIPRPRPASEPRDALSGW